MINFLRAICNPLVSLPHHHLSQLLSNNTRSSLLKFQRSARSMKFPKQRTVLMVLYATLNNNIFSHHQSVKNSIMFSQLEMEVIGKTNARIKLCLRTEALQIWGKDPWIINWQLAFRVFTREHLFFLKTLWVQSDLFKMQNYHADKDERVLYLFQMY